MKLSLNWLKDFIDLKESPDQIAEMLTNTGLEVEHVEETNSIKGGLKGLVIGEVITCEKHPDADKLSITTVDVGQQEHFPIVCGAPNVAKGQKVAVALPGTTIHPTEGEPFIIKKAKIRGQVSMGMICAEDEIGLGKSHEGILVLETDLPNGTLLTELYHVEQDHIFEIGLTPNRGDATSHRGAAIDLFAVTGTPLKTWEPDQEPSAVGSWKKHIHIEDATGCPRYVGVGISNLSIKDSPGWLEKRLKSIGIAPKNHAVDITNYMLHGFGQPMHVFDADKVHGDVYIRRAKEGESLVALNEKELSLHPDDLVIADESGPIALAGVMGGLHSAVTGTTTNIFLESAYFHPDTVRASSTRHGIKSDSSFAYERAIDPWNTSKWAEMAANLICEIGGGSYAAPLVDVYPASIDFREIITQVSFFQKRIGKQLPKDKIFEILQRLDMECQEIDQDKFLAKVPPYRFDVTRPADLVEEVLRIYGLNNIEVGEGYSVQWVSPKRNNPEEDLKPKVASFLHGVGFQEIITNSLTNPDYIGKLPGIEANQTVHMLNYSSKELSMMRQSLLMTGLESVARNINHKNNDLRLFEFGKTYHRTEKGYQEEWRLMLYLTGNLGPIHWQEETRQIAYHDAVQIFQLLLDKLQIAQVKPKDELPAYMAYGFTYEVKKKPIAYLGKVHPKTLKVWDIKQEVFVVDVAWEYLSTLFSSKQSFTPLPKFPAVQRDLSLVMDEATKFSELEKLAWQAGQPLLQTIEVFDIYQGENLPAGKKSYSLRFVLQDPKKTLTDKEIDATMENIATALQKTGAELRS